MTTSQVLYPIIGALVAAEAEIGPDRKWIPENRTQRDFLDTVFSPSRSEVASIPEMTSISSHSHRVINDFLRSQGFAIELDPFPNPRDFGVASVLKLALEWSEVGTISELQGSGNGLTYPAVRMTKGIQFFSTPQNPYPVVKISTKTGDEVYLTMVDGHISEHYLGSTAARILGSLGYPVDDFSGVTFPMINLDHRPDISWILGLNTLGEDSLPAIIAQAMQQTKFAMDELGAKVESAVALGVYRSLISAKVHHIINRPFLAVVKRPSLKQPIFVGYLDIDCWGKPVR